MRRHLALALLSSLSATAAAQLNELGIYPDATDATSRSTFLGADGGDLLICYWECWFTGIGQHQLPDTRIANRVNGFRAVIQDQNGRTQEPYSLLIRRRDRAVERPDPTPAGVLFRTAVLRSPSSNGTSAWRITVTLQTPWDNLPASETFYLGLSLPPNAAWRADGLSVHMASYYGLGSGWPRRHDNPRDGAPPAVWAVKPSTSRAAAVPDRTHRLHLLLEGAALNVGADIVGTARVGPNPSFGVAGIYPDTTGRGATRCSYCRRNGSNDGAAFRAAAAREPGCRIVLLGSGSSSGPPVRFPGHPGFFYLDPLTFFTAGVFTNSGGASTVFAPAYLQQGRIPVWILGKICWQYACIDARGRIQKISNVAYDFFG